MCVARLGDKFFVDQVRTSESVVQSMAGKGVFWLAHSVVDRSLLACVYLSVCDGEESVGPVHSLECGIVEPAVVGRVGSIGMLTISPSLQKCGVGKQLLLYAEAEAAYAGCSETKVECSGV